ncbi:APC family permease [Thermogemmatispora sp.]|jgi:amino acid transporter|uniref:APC family permease n=1 Tax=Thermogemmatispora sp. TaxID=1968838 RepID=UPI0035E3FFB9
MATETGGEVRMQPTLGLTGVTINAMALIAPGAFLWTTYQIQAVPSSAMNMWFSVFIATAIAMLTAIAYATLARRYPEAGPGSSYYFAEAAVLQQEEHRHFKFARLSKFIVGWASHLYYWIYPGVMVAFMGLVITYIIQTFVPSFGAPWQEVLVCLVFALIVGAIAYIGVTGATLANIIINAIQIIALVSFSILAIVYRIQHPELHYMHPNPLSVVLPHDLGGLIFQSTIAILLVVGFESATALAAEAKNPARDIPRGVILSLVIQAVIFYFLEYFAANFLINDGYKNAGGSGFAAANSSVAPIGDLARIIGDSLLGGNGLAYAMMLAASVVVALLGTSLSCLNTGVRVTYAMGKDTELPVVFGFLHGRFRTPHVGVIVLTIISALVGSYGVLNVNNLTQVTLISNIGTFLLYGMTCLICLIAFRGVPGRSIFSTIVAPVLGALMNILMLVGVLYYAITAGGASQLNTIIAALFAVAWLVIGFGYLYIRKLVTGKPILYPEDHKEKLGLKVGAGSGVLSGESS